MDFAEFREEEPGRYKKLARERRKYFQNLAEKYARFADLIREHAPIPKEKKWPTRWMQGNKTLMENFKKKKAFFPILQYLTDHALHRIEDETTKYGLYLHESGNEYRYIVVKVNRVKIGDHIGASADTVKKIIGAMNREGFIKKLANTYYAIGYWGSHRNRIFFLKNTKENREKLVHFSYR